MDESSQIVRVARCFNYENDIPNVDLEFVLSNNFDGVWSVNNQFKSLDSHPTWILIDLEKVVCTFFFIST